ncbi:MAG: DUF6391 domain-containing protein [Anaerolineae bacterium]|jgi:hypothetical protein|nr:hypothetical protein [Chloroflexota bacterium]
MPPSILARIRKNHALEHATLHMLEQGPLPGPVAAHSDWNGITFYGRVDRDVLCRALTRALSALQAGESHLALHSRCGSTIAVPVLSGLIIGLLLHHMSHTTRKESASALTLAGVLSPLLCAEPLALGAQKQLLTDPHVGSAELLTLRTLSFGRITLHRAAIGYR